MKGITTGEYLFIEIDKTFKKFDLSRAKISSSVITDDG